MRKRNNGGKKNAGLCQKKCGRYSSYTSSPGLIGGGEEIGVGHNVSNELRKKRK